MRINIENINEMIKETIETLEKTSSKEMMDFQFTDKCDNKLTLSYGMILSDNNKLNTELKLWNIDLTLHDKKFIEFILKDDENGHIEDSLGFKDANEEDYINKCIFNNLRLFC